MFEDKNENRPSKSKYQTRSKFVANVACALNLFGILNYEPGFPNYLPDLFGSPNCLQTYLILNFYLYKVKSGDLDIIQGEKSLITKIWLGGSKLTISKGPSIIISSIKSTYLYSKCYTYPNI